MSEPRTVCFITPGHLASNPRLVKEASAAAAAGYRVHVVFTQYMDELAPADDEILAANPCWNARRIDWRRRRGGARMRRSSSALRQRAALKLFNMIRWPGFGVRAIARMYDDLLDLATRARADVYVAHNLEALPVAAAAARRSHARCAFNAEDFHRGQLTSESPAAARRLVEWTERTFLPECAYVTASSDGIADAYREAIGIDQPPTVLNVSPLAERNTPVDARRLAAERCGASRTLYWFSQTIGPGRGLEDAVDALALLDPSLHLVLRGLWAPGYERELIGRAHAVGVGHRLHRHETAPPSWMVPLAAQHDLGLALEPPRCHNARICASNKLFTYLAAGIPVVATETDGQRRSEEHTSE